ncbi:MAG: ribonuclease P protein component [Rhodospirillales bacterium]|nr:ribonuclease P protein component [Rhodospirillales bacterium]
MRIATLKKRSDFLRVRAAARRWAAPGLVLQAAPAPAVDAEDELVRVGYTASRRIGNAVARNRAKRRLRAAVAHVMPASAQCGCDYVVIARAATLTRPFDALVGDLAAALARVGTRPGDRAPDRRRRAAAGRTREAGPRAGDA